MSNYPGWLILLFVVIVIRLLVLQFRVRHISTEYYHNLITTCSEINTRLTMIRIHYKDVNREEWIMARSKINDYIDQQRCSINDCILNGNHREHAKRALAVLETVTSSTDVTIVGNGYLPKGPHLS